MKKTIFYLSIAVAALTVLSACSKESGAGGAVSAEVVFNCEFSSVQQGCQADLNALLAEPLPEGAVIEWSSSSNLIGRVGPDGVFTGTGFGLCNVTAKCGEFETVLPIYVEGGQIILHQSKADGTVEQVAYFLNTMDIKYPEPGSGSSDYLFAFSDNGSPAFNETGTLELVDNQRNLVYFGAQMPDVGEPSFSQLDFSVSALFLPYDFTPSSDDLALSIIEGMAYIMLNSIQGVGGGTVALTPWQIDEHSLEFRANGTRSTRGDGVKVGGDVLGDAVEFAYFSLNPVLTDKPI